MSKDIWLSEDELSGLLEDKKTVKRLKLDVQRNTDGEYLVPGFMDGCSSLYGGHLDIGPADFEKKIYEAFLSSSELNSKVGGVCLYFNSYKEPPRDGDGNSLTYFLIAHRGSRLDFISLSKVRENERATRFFIEDLGFLDHFKRFNVEFLGESFAKKFCKDKKVSLDKYRYQSQHLYIFKP